MIRRAVKLIRAEWKLSLFFVFIILLLGSLSTFVLKGTFFEETSFKMILFGIGLNVYNGYFIYLGKVLKGEEIGMPYKFILFEKDKNRYDFAILLALFGAIMMIFQGPMILFQVLLSQKLNEMLASLGQWAILFNIVILLGSTAYRISLYSAVASITYHQNEVLEAFKDGIKGMWRFKVILIVLLIFSIALSFLDKTRNITIFNVVTLVSYIIPAIVMFLMSCSYSLADVSIAPIKESEDCNDDKEPASDNGIHSG